MDKPLLTRQIKAFALFALLGAISGWVAAVVYDSAWAAVFSSSGPSNSFAYLKFATNIFPGIMFGLALLAAFYNHNRGFLRWQTLAWLLVSTLAYFVADEVSLYIMDINMNIFYLSEGEVGSSISFAVEGAIRALVIAVGFNYLHSKITDSKWVIPGFVALGGILGVVGILHAHLYESPVNSMFLFPVWHAGMAGVLGAVSKA